MDNPLISSLCAFCSGVCTLFLHVPIIKYLYFCTLFQFYSCSLNPSTLASRSSCDLINRRITTETGYSQQSFVHFVRDAAYAFATSLHNLHKKLCHGVPGVCEAMRHVDGLTVYEHLKNVSFKGEYIHNCSNFGSYSLLAFIVQRLVSFSYFIFTIS